MKVATSFYETSVPFPANTCAEITKLLKSNAAKFIERAQINAGEYQHLAKAWDGGGATPADIRDRIENLARLSKSAAQALAALSDTEDMFIRQAQAIERCSDIVLKDLQENLRRVASACERAVKFAVLNKGRGSTSDDARRSFIAHCAEAYKDATGKAPARSSTGTFAKVMKLALKATGADDGISNDLLKSIIRR